MSAELSLQDAQLPNGVTFHEIAGGDYHTLALDENGNAWAWGNDYYGGRGDGNMEQRLGTPVPTHMP